MLDIRVQNVGLLMKFLHSFYNKRDTPWCELIWSTYYEGKIPHATDTCGSFWWRDVMDLSDTYRGITNVKVGDGSTALFWKDMWHDRLLELSHPRAFSFAKEEDTSVADFLAMTTLHEEFYLPVSSQAREEIRELQMITAHTGPWIGASDEWVCSWGPKYSSRQ